MMAVVYWYIQGMCIYPCYLQNVKHVSWSRYLNIFSSLIILLFLWGAKNYLLLACRFLFSNRFGFLTLGYLGFKNIYFIYIYMYVSAIYV